jgi:hypothetical protein
MGFLRDFGLPELIIVLSLCSFPVLVIGGVIFLVRYLNKNKNIK